MPSHKDSFLRTKLPQISKAYTDRLQNQIQFNKDLTAQGVKDDNAFVRGVDRIVGVLDELENLRKLDIQLFGEDGNLVPTEKQFQDYIDKCTSAYMALKEMQELSTNEVVTDPDVKDTAMQLGLLDTEDFRLELMPYIHMGKPEKQWNISNAQKARIPQLLTDAREQLMAIEFDRAQDSYEAAYNKRWIEHPYEPYENFVGSIPPEVQLSGNVTDLASYYLENENELTPDERAYLRGRMGTLVYFDELQKQNESKEYHPVFTVHQGNNGDVHLDGYQNKYQYQSTHNGCWSCAYAMLLESRGVSLNQTILRAFRPKANVNDMSGVQENQVPGVLYDHMYSPYEMADLTSTVLPKSALRQVTVSQYTKADIPEVKTAMLQTIREAITEHHSPVALLNGVHYVTVVGIEGNNLKILDSRSNKPGLEDTLPIDTVLNNNNRLQLNFVQDLQLDRSGRIINRPAGFDGISYKNGRLVDVNLGNDPMSRRGNTFGRSFAVGNLLVEDALYAPNEIPAAQFSKDAVNLQNNENPVVHNNEYPEPDADFFLFHENQKENGISKTEEKAASEFHIIAGKSDYSFDLSNEAQEKFDATAIEVKDLGEIDEILQFNEEDFDYVHPEAAMKRRIDAAMNKPKEEIATENLDESFHIEMDEPKKEKKPEPEKESDETRAMILKEIEDAHNQLVNVVNDWDNLADPNSAFRYTAATLLANETLLEAYDHTTVPTKKDDFKQLVGKNEIVQDIYNSKDFNAFLPTADIDHHNLSALIVTDKEERMEADHNFYRDFVKSIGENKKVKDEKKVKTEKKVEKERRNELK